MHGYSYGFAIDLSAAADVRICTRDVRFSVKEVDIGIAADIGVLSRPPKIVGNFGWVKEVALSARLFGAEEALRVRSVNSIHDSKEAMMGTALDIASLRYTAVWSSAAMQTGDVSKALTAGIEKRTPTFEKL
ncbi:ClpP/crotonase-like domain-containing protein [Aspergillus novoparasiticus]|uniref:ClpP/crotonase-like domain-containing protein n=1 Tax=Aspergillus novoparasiticus TaxID=986946 RepID=A0A5N6EPZ8_9EURO|nr:ClpP/crotonase-like domain-containing protein [Aspergillus novoparasiticus]